MAGTNILTINWFANDWELVSKLITKLKRPENFKVFLGKKKKYNMSDMPFFLLTPVLLTLVKEYKWGFKGKGHIKDGTGHPSKVV